MKKMNNKGFTIVELVIVIAVIAILAAVMIPTFSGVVSNAKESAAIQEVKAAYTNTLSVILGNDNPADDNLLSGTFNIAAKNGVIVTVTDGNVAKAEGANVAVTPGWAIDGDQIKYTAPAPVDPE